MPRGAKALGGAPWTRGVGQWWRTESPVDSGSVERGVRGEGGGGRSGAREGGGVVGKGASRGQDSPRGGARRAAAAVLPLSLRHRARVSAGVRADPPWVAALLLLLGSPRLARAFHSRPDGGSWGAQGPTVPTPRPHPCPPHPQTRVNKAQRPGPRTRPPPRSIPLRPPRGAPGEGSPVVSGGHAHGRPSAQSLRPAKLSGPSPFPAPPRSGPTSALRCAHGQALAQAGLEASGRREWDRAMLLRVVSPRVKEDVPYLLGKVRTCQWKSQDEGLFIPDHPELNASGRGWGLIRH